MYNLHIRTKKTAKAPTFFDTDDAFKIIPSSSMIILEETLVTLFACQAIQEGWNIVLLLEPSNKDFINTVW